MNTRECWWCGKVLAPDETVCKECADYVKENGMMPGWYDRNNEPEEWYCDGCGEEIDNPFATCLYCGYGGSD